jgi:hypothetical protein
VNAGHRPVLRAATLGGPAVMAVMAMIALAACASPTTRIDIYSDSHAFALQRRNQHDDRE